MFIGVNEKLERANHFLSNLKTLAEEAGGFPYIRKGQEMRANLDGFFFEIISAKDFFLQGINDNYGNLLPKNECTKNLGKLEIMLKDIDTNAFEVIHHIKTLLSSKGSWLWVLNNYRNSATHRELLHFGNVVSFTCKVDKATFDKLKQKKLTVKPVFEGEEKTIQSDIPKVNIPLENIKTYLFKDPEDPSQGNLDIEVIQYCEQSLETMKSFLDSSFAKLN